MICTLYKNHYSGKTKEICWTEHVTLMGVIGQEAVDYLFQNNSLQLFSWLHRASIVTNTSLSK